MKDTFIRRIANALERTNKAFWYTFVFPLVYPQKIVAPCLADVDRLLVFRSDAIGDMILTTPVFRVLKKHNPAIRLWVAASDRNAEVIAADPDVERVVILEKSGKIQHDAVQALRSFHPQVIMNCVTNRTTKYGMLAKRIARDSFTVALAHNERPEYRKLYSRVIDVPNMYERPYAEIMLEFVRQTFNVPITAGDELPRIGIEEIYTDEAKDFLRSSAIPLHAALLVNLSAGQPRKRWSEEKYIALIDMLCDKFDAVILTASPEDREKAARISNRYDNKVHLFHSANIRSLAALAAQCLMVVTPDTSVVHVAAAVRVPVVTWNSSIENAVSQWIPNGIPYRAVYTDQYNAEAVPPEDVFKNVNELYSAIAL